MFHYAPNIGDGIQLWTMSPNDVQDIGGLVRVRTTSFGQDVGLQALKSPKLIIFGINLPLRENSGGPQKLLYIGAHCTTPYLPVCNDIINVLKITLLHSISVITKFVIPKCEKNRKNKSITLFHPQPAHDPRSTPYLVWQ